MSNVLRLAIVDPDDSKRESLKIMLLGMDMIWLEAECSRYEFFTDVVAQTNPDIGLVAMDADPDKALDLVARSARTRPQCAVLVTSSSNDGHLILRAMRAGAKEFLTQPVRIEDLLAALGRISERRVRRRREPPPRQPGGGRGRRRWAAWAPPAWPSTSPASWPRTTRTPWPWWTSTSAWATPTSSSTPSPTTRWSTWPRTSPGSDFSLLKRSLTKHSSGVYLLPRPVQLEDVGADQRRRPAAGDRPAEGHLHAPGARSLQGLQPAWTWWPWKWPPTSCWSRSSTCPACGTWSG